MSESRRHTHPDATGSPADSRPRTEAANAAGQVDLGICAFNLVSKARLCQQGLGVAGAVGRGSAPLGHQAAERAPRDERTTPRSLENLAAAPKVADKTKRSLALWLWGDLHFDPYLDLDSSGFQSHPFLCMCHKRCLYLVTPRSAYPLSLESPLLSTDTDDLYSIL